jgi:hypothetical protein
MAAILAFASRNCSKSIAQVKRKMKPKRSYFRTFVAPAIAGIAIIPTVLIAVRAVRSGRGADSYRNVYGLAIPYTSVLIFFGMLIVAAAIAYLARIIYYWRIGHDRTAKLRTIQPHAPDDNK